MMHFSIVVALLLAYVASTSGGSNMNQGSGQAKMNIIELANSLGASSFLNALKDTSLTEVIRSARDITVFVPTNAAFNALSASTLQFLSQNPAAYVEILKYHVVQGLFPANKLTNELVLTTVGNYKTRFNIYNHTKMANIALYMGSVLNSANNFAATNGIIHFIDSVVVSPQSTLNSLEYVLNSTTHTKLVQLVKSINSAKLGALLTNTKSPHTLFAPNDDAFQKLPAGTFDSLLKNPTLAESIIRLHISDLGTYFSNGIMNGEMISSSNFANKITVNKYKNGSVRLNNKSSTVVKADIATSTGVIHVIDTILAASAGMA